MRNDTRRHCPGSAPLLGQFPDYRTERAATVITGGEETFAPRWRHHQRDRAVKMPTDIDLLPPERKEIDTAPTAADLRKQTAGERNLISITPISDPIRLRKKTFFQKLRY